MHLLLSGVGRKFHGEASGSFPHASRKFIRGWLMKGRQHTLDRATVAGFKLDDGKSDQIFFDADMKGFGFRMRLDGARLRRTWVVQYRIRNRTRRLRIGDYPTITADQARKKAKEALAKVQLGQDPQAEKEAERTNGSRTLRSVAEQYLEMKE